ncbi:MAG: hypothetical protein A3E82_08205 [Gammaproteobacteria bacterium RIFCSPHIGHO2_12_FULL_38_11]|nr:MAG: hypothetical protein A3E82_08205 [Gammaproteobacteria bacterium RIFCSPHIGHO2_12_FULL_38_11]
MKQIVAIGGGGFSSETRNLKIEKYLLSLVNKKNPKICFLPQASHEDPDYIVKFFSTFVKLHAEPSWISLFGRVEASWKQHILNQDIIYVGGGNTKSMLALWREWGMDVVLMEAYNNGIILSGVSAGGICWFEQGITDSVWPLGVVNGLGLIDGSVCPHFDSECERQSVYRNKLATAAIKPGLALEDETAVHFIDGQLNVAIKTLENKNVIRMNANEEIVLQTELLS